MLCINFIKIACRDMFSDLNLIGKTLFFPLFLVFAMCLIFLAIFEFIFIDIITLLFFACSKTLTVKDFFSDLEFK